MAPLVVVGIVRTDLELTKGEAIGFLVLYGLFLLWMTLESIGSIGTIQGL
mgnify:CR=1 FL=1